MVCLLLAEGSLCHPRYLPVKKTGTKCILVIIHSVPSSNHSSNHTFHIPCCNIDKFIIKRKCEVNGKSENDAIVESQTLKSVTDSVPDCKVSVSSVEPSTSKPKIPKDVSAK